MQITAPTGVLISWASPALIIPRAAIFSDLR